MIDGGGGNRRFLDYPNVARSIGTVVSSRLATLHELDTALGVGDLYDLIEVVAVDAYNQRVANQEE